jgi:threonine dehydratase
LQVTGSFKLRGAYYKISQLSPEEKARGIIACSAGNHAQGVALAAAKNGIEAVICIPDSAPISKIEATRSYGVKVELVPGSYDDAYARALEMKEERGLTFIHPFNDVNVIAGQGTIGLEILDQMPDVQAVVVPVGGGGLIAGVAYTLKNLRPGCKVYGVQAANAPSMLKSIQKGKPVTLDTAATFADGIAVKQPGDLTFEMVRRYVDGVVDVTEDEIASAILALMERQKLVAEGAGAVAIAAAMHGRIDLEGRKTVCLLSGGNIDVNILSRVITRGLVNSGRNTSLTIALVDKPGQLEGVSRLVAGHGGNVVSVQYDRSDPKMPINSCYLTLGLETRGHAQLAEIKRGLADAGFEIVPAATALSAAAVT